MQIPRPPAASPFYTSSAAFKQKTRGQAWGEQMFNLSRGHMLARVPQQGKRKYTQGDCWWPEIAEFYGEIAWPISLSLCCVSWLKRLRKFEAAGTDSKTSASSSIKSGRSLSILLCHSSKLFASLSGSLEMHSPVPFEAGTNPPSARRLARLLRRFPIPTDIFKPPTSVVVFNKGGHLNFRLPNWEAVVLSQQYYTYLEHYQETYVTSTLSSKSPQLH